MATKAAVEKSNSQNVSGDSPLLDSLNAEVKKMLARGKERGYVTYDELNTALPPDQVSSEQIEHTMSMLSEAGINVVENEEIIALNYEIMQLYTSTISPQGVTKLKYAIQNDGVDLNRTQIRTMLLKDGIGTLNIDELMLMLNSHKKV